MLSITKNKANSIVLCSLFAAFIAVLGLVPGINLGFGVPITLQTLGVMLAGCLLGAKRGFQAVLIYLVAGLVGLPIFAGGSGGIRPFVGPSAGYLIAFPFCAFGVGVLFNLFNKLFQNISPIKLSVSAFFACILSFPINHTSGIIWLSKSTQISLKQAFYFDLMFIPGDIIKCFIISVIVYSVAKALPDWFKS